MAVTSVTSTLDGQTTELTASDDTYSAVLTAPVTSSPVSVTASDEHGNLTTQTRTIEVNTEWLPPKTDWQPTDYINYTDINRIMNNLYYLKRIASYFFTIGSFVEMVEKSGYTYYRFASEINAIEQNLETLNTDTMDYDIGETKTYYPNNPTIDYQELNRIESAILRLYGVLNGSYKAIHTLSFTLGGEKGIKV